MGFLFGIAGFVGTLLLIAIAVVLVIYFARRNKNSPVAAPGQRPPAQSALHILDERLASGQVEIEDYLNRRAALLGQVPQQPQWTSTAAPDAPTTEQPEAPAKD